MPKKGDRKDQDAIHVIVKLKYNGVIVVIGLCVEHVKMKSIL